MSFGETNNNFWIGGIHMTENEKQIQLVCELENVVSSLQDRLTTLTDVTDMLVRIVRLRGDIENLNEAELRDYSMESHRTIRVVSELLKYTVNDVDKECTTLIDIPAKLARYFSGLKDS